MQLDDRPQKGPFLYAALSELDREDSLERKGTPLELRQEGQFYEFPLYFYSFNSVNIYTKLQSCSVF